MCALQAYEWHDAGGRRVAQRQLDVRYDLLEPAAFARLAVAAGFRVGAVWGDYDRSRLDAAASPYALFALER